MNESRLWINTTHEWSATVDTEHLAAVRESASRLAPGGLLHLICEVLAYADDEAETLRRQGHCLVQLHKDGSVSIADDGRGTDTRFDEFGVPVRKPVMATKDLRFFDAVTPPTLPDGHPRRGLSVVDALSSWLTHTNRRQNGAWTQRYERGLPVTELTHVSGTDDTGTTVRFLPARHLVHPNSASAVTVRAVAHFPHLHVDVK